MGRTKRALTAVVMTGVLLGLGGAVSGGAPLGAPGEQPFHMTLEGSLPAGTSTGRFASCGDEYVERGANQTVPHIDFVAYPTVTLFPIVAVGTAPYVFASRAVTSMSLTISNLETDRTQLWKVNNLETDRTQLWKVTWYCTPDKGKAWLVFG